jgi:hypothetical protein
LFLVLRSRSPFITGWASQRGHFTILLSVDLDPCNTKVGRIPFPGVRAPQLGNFYLVVPKRPTIFDQPFSLPAPALAHPIHPSLCRPLQLFGVWFALLT